MTTLIPGIIIILGSPNSKEGDLFSVAKQRCEQGMQEVLRRPGWKILLTGGFGKHFNESDKPHAYYLERYLIEQGLASEAILDSVMSTNTLEDASLTRPVIVQHDVAEILVVTSDYHYDRAQYVFESEYKKTNVRIGFSLCDTDEYACEFDLKSQKVHEKNALRKLQRRS